jgi:hypothetical protein
MERFMSPGNTGTEDCVGIDLPAGKILYGPDLVTLSNTKVELSKAFARHEIGHYLC